MSPDEIITAFDGRARPSELVAAATRRHARDDSVGYLGVGVREEPAERRQPGSLDGCARLDAVARMATEAATRSSR